MFELMTRGGPTMWLILAASVLDFAIFVERLLTLHRSQIDPHAFLDGILNVLKRGNIAEAVSICDETAGPVPRIVRAALLRHDEDAEAVRRAVREAGLAEIPRLERRVDALSAVAQIVLLLGLLGTVLCLVEALMTLQLRAPLVHAGDLGGALWQALLATAAGLAVAIPSYAGYHILLNRVESILLDMEHAAAEIVFHLQRARLPPGPPAT